MFVNRNGFYIPLQRPLKKLIMPQRNHHYFASNLSLIRFVFLMNSFTFRCRLKRRSFIRFAASSGNFLAKVVFSRKIFVLLRNLLPIGVLYIKIYMCL